MKKLYALSLVCLLGLSAYGQITTAPIYASALSGAYVTGNSTAFIRSDGNIVANSTTRGYAVFDLSTAGIPAGSTIGSVIAYINVSGYTAGTITCSTNIYPGDLSTVITASILYPDMTTPAATNVSNVSYVGLGNQTIPSTAAAALMVQNNISGKISYCFANTGTSSFTITGETGAVALTGAHAPYIIVTYCPPPTALTATAGPSPICYDASLTLTGSATGATGGYRWDGPGSFVWPGATVSFPTTVSGVYTLTAVSSCGTFSATATALTSSISVYPFITPSSGPSIICTGNSSSFSNTAGPGTWSSENPGVATIDPSLGTLNAVSGGSTVITYTLASTGCYTLSNLTVNNPPAPITGPTDVCVLSTVTVIETSGGGLWSSSAGTGTATVLGAGDVTGNTAGTVTINFTITSCPAATYAMTVDPLPPAMSGTFAICDGSSTTLNDGTPGGTWSSSDLSIATVGSSSGEVTGMLPGTASIIYTVPTGGCQTSSIMTIEMLPNPISGPANVCPSGTGSTTLLTDGTGGGNWSSFNTGIATITGGGVVSGVATGTTIITYKLITTGCYVTTPITVFPVPDPISGISTFCPGTSVTLNDIDPSGNWTSSNIADATVGSATGVVTGVLGGTPRITYTLPDGCYATATLNVLPAPPAAITASGATTFCTGGSVILTASGGGTAYQWFDGGSPIPGASSQFYTATTGTAYTVEITNASGCTNTSAATIVTAGLAPVINSSLPVTSFCVGTGTVLTANTGGIVGFITYQWAMNGAIIPSGTAATYYANVSGVFTCSVSVTGGSGTCTAVTPPVTVTVFPLPNPVASFNGVSMVTSNVYRSYQWFLNTLSIPGATNYSWTPLENGSYQVEVTDVNGCSWHSNAIEYSNYINTGVGNIPGSSIAIYPNPANNVIHIQSPVAVRAMITGIEGKELKTQANARDVDISDLADGLYIIMLYDNDGNRLLVEKLVKAQ